MPYKPFEESTLWQNLVLLHVQTETLLQRIQPPISDALKRSLIGGSLRASHQMAEVYETGFGAETLPMLGRLRVTLVELRSDLSLMDAHCVSPNQRGDLRRVQDLLDQCSRMLHGWADRVKNPGEKNRVEGGRPPSSAGSPPASGARTPTARAGGSSR